jgi:hypothetical protein
MFRRQRFAQYIQRLAYENLIHSEERDERPDDVPPKTNEQARSYAAWSATSFSGYVPFREPTNG